MRKSVVRVAKNTAAQFAARGLEGASNFAIAILLGRALGPAPLGVFSFLLTSYAGFFVCTGTLGLNLLMTREVARRRHEATRYLGNALGMSGGLALITVGLMVGILRLVSNDPLIHRGIYLAAAYTVLHSWETLFTGVFYALERMELETVGIFVEKLALLAAIFVYVLHGGGVLGVLLLCAAAKALLCAAYVVMAWRLMGFPRPRADFALWRELAARGWPFGVNLFLTQAHFQIYLPLLALLQSEQAAGYFRAGSALALGLPMFANGLANAMLPVMARAYPDRRESFEQGLRQSFTALAGVGLPLAVGLIVLARPLMRAFFGARFGPAVTVFQLLGATVPLKFATNAIGTGLTAANRQTRRTLAITIGVVVDLGLNFFLIPRYGANGAAVAALATDVVILGANFAYLRQASFGAGLLARGARPALAALLMGAALWGLRDVSLAWSIPAGIVAYAVAAVAVGALRAEDVRSLAAALRSSRA